MSVSEYGCSHCGVYACKFSEEAGKHFPKFCLTTNEIGGRPAQEVIQEVKQHLLEDNQDSRILYASAEVEGLFFGKYTRVEEVIEFARRYGAKKIGIATCHGLIRETKIFTKILDAKGFDYIVAGCKVGNLDKTEVGIPNEVKIHPDGFEASCDPILQAKILNAHHTDLNVIIGLCVGHDSLFIKYSDAIVTTLIAKDRVTGHSPANVLYTAEEYRPYLFEKEPKENQERSS